MPTLRPARDVRYYLYRSRAKIEMLFEQMFHDRDSAIRASLALTAGPLSGSITTGAQSEATLTQKLESVEDELKERGLVGSLEEPNEYVRGSIKMRYGMFNDVGLRPEDLPPLVYFGGLDAAFPLIVGLGGSSQNLLGFEGISSTYSRSHANTITKWLLSGITRGAPPWLPDWWDMDAESDNLCRGMAIALHYLKPPTMRMEFLAKVLHTAELDGAGTLPHFTGLETRTRFLLGTPIYVTRASFLPEENRWGLDAEWAAPEPKARPTTGPDVTADLAGLATDAAEEDD